MKKIGRYVIRGLLGRGRMGKVFKVELPAISKIGALKLLDPDPLLVKLIGPDGIRSQFIHEAKTMGELQHPNVAGVHDFDEDRGRPYYVMDYYANNLGRLIGESYRPDRPSRRISTDKALKYIRQSLNGLACLHDAGIVHRDIKPYNLLITSWDTIKICDFGLSKLRGEIFSGPSNLHLGTPFYMPPEQEEDPDGVNAAADLYPLGVMLYRMLTGQLPEAADSNVCPPADRFNSDLDQVWDRFMCKAMAPQPHHRFSSATEMLLALDELTAYWKKQKDLACRLPADEAVATPDRHQAPTGRRLRSHPIKTHPKKARRKFRLDMLWRPEVYIDNRFESIAVKTVVDRGTGCIWQQSGSPFPRTWKQATDYVDQLNRTKYAGLMHWRLPTVEELASLLQPAPLANDLCIAPVFDPVQRRLWSCDRSSFIAAYYADIELGFIDWHDFSAACHVRAVCTMSG